MQYNIEIDIGRGKGYPQTDSDPHPCTTQIRASVLNNTYSTTLAPEQCSSIQKESNAPFYKDILKFLVDGESVDEMILLVKVIEFTREPEPFVLFYGKQLIRPNTFRTRKEVTISLSTINPADSEGEETQGSATLSMRLVVTKSLEKDTAGLYEDVDIEDDIAYDGTCSVVPTDSTYFWFHLLTNKRWNNSFREALIATWRSLEPLEKSEKPKQTKDSRIFSRDTAAVEPVLHSIGDVVKKKWCCRRTHQILTRLRICGEKFFKKGVPLVFTTEEEIAFRTEKKKRAQILLKMAQDSLTKSGNSKLRDWMERLWVLYAVGIDNDPSGPKTLNYDLRKKVYDTPFDDEDTIMLQSCLIYFFVPSLQFEFCQQIVEEENRMLFAQSEVIEDIVDKAPAENSGKQPKITPHQERFTSVLMWIVGSMLDTLTEVELLRAVKAVKPAVWDAQQRVLKGGKIGIKERIHHGAAFRSAFKGEGINIAHLDKLGNRKKTVGA